MEKSLRLSPALLLVGIALLIGTGMMLVSVWLNSQKTASPFQKDVVSLLPTIEPTYEFTVTAGEFTPLPTFDNSFVPTIAPVEDWETHTDELEGISLQYPRGWFITELPLEIRRTSSVYVVYLSNFDPQDQVIMNLPKGSSPPQLFSMMLSFSKQGTSGIPVPPGQTLKEWAHLYKLLPETAQWVEEGYIPIAATQAYRLAWQNLAGEQGVNVIIPEGENILAFSYRLDSASVFAETAGQIIESLEFTQ